MMSLIRNPVVISLLLTCAAFRATAAPTPEPVFYITDGAARTAYIYKPAGEGPFPVMVYCQATPKPSPDSGEPSPFPVLASYYVSRGWALFLPGRPLLSGPAPGDAEKPAQTEEQKFMSAISAHNDNITMAIKALNTQAFVDPERIFVSGHSTGGINTFLLAEKKSGVRGCIVFSPGAKIWHDNELLRDAMMNALENAKVPIFLIQAQNDFNLGPVVFLGPEISKKGRPNRTKVYDPFGKTQADGNSLAFQAPAMWGDDVFRFIDEVLALPKK